MTVSLSTGSGLNLNDGTGYWLVRFDPGSPVRDEVWIEPRGASSPTLAARTDRKTMLHMILRVKGTSVGDLSSKLEAVRNEFEQQDNTLVWSLGSTSRVFLTRPSAIGPAYDLNTLMFEPAGRFEIRRWHLSIWRDPYYSGETRLPVA